jgi:hypothetical protein
MSPPGPYRVSEPSVRPADVALPRQLELRIRKAELEFFEAGANEYEQRVTRELMRTPEAILREGGYSEPRTQQEQELEVDAAIDMARRWLRKHMERRQRLERAARGGDGTGRGDAAGSD